jgi:uncharacterized protein YjbJ (UPF0337 family)
MGDKTDRTRGKVKEVAGRATNDEALERQGRNEQAKGKLKQSAENAKEAVDKAV